MPKTQTDNERFNEFELHATLFGSRTSRDMWGRYDVTMAVITCGPGPLMGTELNAIAHATVTRRFIVTAESIASDVSSNEIEFRLKSNPTMSATSTTVKLKMVMTPDNDMKLNVLLIMQYQYGSRQFEK